MRTDHPDVFAVGDCAEKRDFTTRKVSTVMLASTATSEARVGRHESLRLVHRENVQRHHRDLVHVLGR